MADNKYEALVVYSVKNGEEAAQALKNRFAELIAGNGSLDEENGVDDWGKRKLAYPINYETDGYYVLYNFVSDPEFPKEFDRVLNITDGVLRSMITRVGG